MNATVGHARTRNWEFAHRHLLAVAAGATAVLGLLLAIGAWQAFSKGSADNPNGVVAPARTAAAAEVPMTVYIVADEAQREKVLLAEDDAAMVRFAGGDLAANNTVDVIVAAEAARLDQLLLDLATANDIRIQQGLAPVPVVDLR